MKRYITTVWLLGILLISAETYLVPMKNLGILAEKGEEKILEDALDEMYHFSSWSLRSGPQIEVRVKSMHEAYFGPKPSLFEKEGYDRKTETAELVVAIKTPQNQDGKNVVGYINLPLHNKVKSFRFSLDTSKLKPCDEKIFDDIKRAHYYLLSQTNFLGKSWFSVMGEGGKITEKDSNGRQITTSLSFFTGGRAVSDNLALDRDIRLMGDDLDATVDLKSVKGITVKELEWKALLEKIPNADKIEIDTLAMLIPSDQHVMICPSMSAVNDIIALIEDETSAIAQSYTVRNPFRTLPSKYKKQLGLNLPPALMKMAPVKSIAVTGYDPFFPTGTDVAVLLESDQPDGLFKLLSAAIKDKPRSHIAKLGKVIVLSNSKLQMYLIKQVHAGKLTSLGSLDEYRFFRHRYPVKADVTGFVFLSDACIRRWGGPELRIAASRRNKAIGMLNRLTAQQILLESKQPKAVIDNDDMTLDQAFLLGEIKVRDGMIHSEKMGNLDFITPAIEMQLSKITKAEAAAYIEWRTGYEKGWSKVFDPIGFSFKLDPKSKEFDLTVMPLTINNSYREVISVIGKSLISREAKIRHSDQLMLATIAIDKDSEAIESLNNLATMYGGGFFEEKAFDWLGSSASFFLEKHMKLGLLGTGRFDEEILLDTGGLRIEYNPKKKAHVLKFMDAFEKLLGKELKAKPITKKHGEQAYKKLDIDRYHCFYAITENALIITGSEHVLINALKREKVELKLKLSPVQENADHLFFSGDALAMLNFERGMDGDNNLQDQRRNQSYRAIPILNEWHRIWNKKQATAVHLNRFGEDIYCPGGKGYRWNADEMTMESVTFGHPGNQKKVTLDPKVTQQLGELESGFRFENDGLRVRLKLKPKKEAKKTSKVILNPGTTILGIADDFIPTAEGLKWEYDLETSLRNADSEKTKLTITNVSFKNKRLTQRSIREGNTYESISKIDNGIYSIQSKGSEVSTVYKPAYTYAPKEFRLG